MSSAVASSHGSSSNAFQQTGNVNWVSLGSKTVSFGIGVLDRYAKAGVDIATMGIGGTMCKPFLLPLQKKKMLLERVENLPQVLMYGKIIRFGFGLQHILADLAGTDEGLTCLALCGCLTSSYDSFFAAQVLRELCICQGVPDDNIPGIKRWIALLKICSGILTGTKFITLVEGLSRILQPIKNYGVAQITVTEPKALAKALIFLAQISNKEIENCTFTGGVDCAWLAAVAEFIFDFSVRVMDSNGTIFYDSNSRHMLEPREHQVTIMSSTEPKSGLSLIAKAFHVPSGRVLFRNSALELRGISQFEHRSSWNSIIRDTFGDSGNDLLRDRTGENFARLFLFNACRLTSRIDGDKVKPEWKYEWADLGYGFCGLRGHDLLSFTSWRLPELKTCIENLLDQRVGEIEEYEARKCLQNISDDCGCPACTQQLGNDDQFICLVGIASTIMQYAALLSAADVVDVLPTPIGLRSLYQQSRPRILPKKPSRKLSFHLRSPEMGPWSFRWAQKGPCLIQDVLKLFCTPSSYSIVNVGSEHIAFSTEGLCCFYGFLWDIKLPPHRVAKVYVMAGHIEYKGSFFEKLRDIDLDTQMWAGFNCSIERTFDLFVTETAESNTLEAAYATKADSIGPPCKIAISKIAQWAQGTRHDQPILCDSKWSLKMFSVLEVQLKVAQPSLGNSNQFQSINTCQYPYDDNPGYSLFLIMTDKDKPDSLVIHKTSEKFWDDKRTKMEHLYAEYANKYKRSGEGVFFYLMGKVSDCVGCIMIFLYFIFMDDFGNFDFSAAPLMRGYLLSRVLTGKVVIHDQNGSHMETYFELSWKTRSVAGYIIDFATELRFPEIYAGPVLQQKGKSRLCSH